MQREQLRHVLRDLARRVIDAEFDALGVGALDEVAERGERVVAVGIIDVGRVETGLVDIDHVGAVLGVGLRHGIVQFGAESGPSGWMNRTAHCFSVSSVRKGVR